VYRTFTATAPTQLWVADITYCRTFTGWVYAAFVTDVFSHPPGHLQHRLGQPGQAAARADQLHPSARACSTNV
jgi:hypothetical protein